MATSSTDTTPNEQPPTPIGTKLANRYVLPMSTGTKRVKPGETAQITSRPQHAAFRLERLFVSSYTPRSTEIEVAYRPRRKLSWWRRLFGARRLEAQLESQIDTLIDQVASLTRAISEDGKSIRGAADWLILDILVGNRSQLAQAGELSGDMFSSNAIDSYLTFDTAQVAMDVVLIVSYRGPVKEGCAFVGSFIGTAAS